MRQSIQSKLILFGTASASLLLLLAYQNCTESGNGPAMLNTPTQIACKLPDGSLVPDKQTVTLYKEQINANCSAISQRRTCDGKSGKLSGDDAFKYTNCSASGGNGSCSWKGQSYSTNQQVSAFVQSTITWSKPASTPNPSSGFCDNSSNIVTRTCQANGTWSGSGFETCQYQLELPASSNVYNASLDDKINALYLGVLRRFPDPAGFEYWKNEASSKNWDIAQLSGSLAYAAEQAPNQEYPYPASLSNSAFVDQHYLNSFGYGSEQAGRDYWANEIATGHFSRYQIHGVINDALISGNIDNFSSLTPAMQELGRKRYWTFFNRLLAAKYFAIKVPNPGIVKDSKSYFFVKGLATSVNETPQSLKDAYDKIDAFVP